MDTYRKAQMAERTIFGLLVILLVGAGFLYGWFEEKIPGWELVGWLTAYMCACSLAYLIALRFVLRKL